MKISKHYLQRIIKEELNFLLGEQEEASGGAAKGETDAVIAKIKSTAMRIFNDLKRQGVAPNEAKKVAMHAWKTGYGIAQKGGHESGAIEAAMAKISKEAQWKAAGIDGQASAGKDAAAGKDAPGGKIQPLIDKAIADNKEKIDAALAQHDNNKAMGIVRTAVVPQLKGRGGYSHGAKQKIDQAVTNYIAQRSGGAETAVAKQPAPAAEKVHTVKPGESLTRVAKKYPGVKWRDIAKLNNIAGPRYITQPGQKLKIPGGENTGAVATTKATVRTGDTAETVATPSGAVPRGVRQ